MNQNLQNDNLVNLVEKLSRKNPRAKEHKELLSKQKKEPENYIICKDGTIAETKQKYDRETIQE